MRAAHTQPALLVVLPVLVSVLCLFPGISDARTIEVKEPLETYRIRLEAGQRIELAFKSPLLEWEYPKKWKVNVKVKSDTISLKASRQVKPQQISGLLVVYARHYTLYLIVEPAPAGKGDTTIVVNHRSLMEVIEKLVEERVAEERAKREQQYQQEMATLQTQHMEAMAVQDRQHEEREAELIAKNTRVAERAVARLVSRGFVMHSLEDARNCSVEGIVLCGTRWGKVGKQGLLQLEVINDGTGWLNAGGIEVSDATETGKDRAGGFSVLDHEDSPDGEPRIAVPPGGRVQVAVIVHDPESLGDRLRVALLSPTRVVVAMRVLGLGQSWAKARITLSATGTYGAAWFAEDPDGNRTDATTLEMIGARYTMGFNDQPTDPEGDPRFMLSLEVAIAVGRTGNSQFAGAMLDGIQGDLSRSAKLGRLQAGGLVRWGRGSVQGFLRFGAGVQVAGIDSAISQGDNVIMRDSSTQAGFFVAGSGGVDAWLGDSLLLGTGLFMERAVGAEQLQRQSIGLGIHLGIAWEPKRGPPGW